MVTLFLLVLVLGLAAEAGHLNVVFWIGQDTYRYTRVADGVAVEGRMDVRPFIENGRTYVPVRYLGYALGVAEKDITWDPAEQRVILAMDGTSVQLTVASRVLYVNGRPREMDVVPLLKDGCVFLPARFVAEAFAYEVGWDPNEQAVLVGPKRSLTESPAQSSIRTVEALVTSVIDGDTFHVRFDGRDEKVRLIGVDCPEITHPELGIEEEAFGSDAKIYAEGELSGRRVWLEFDVQERDRYGRLLAYVWLEPLALGTEGEARAKMFNARLLLEGFAQVMTVPPNVKYADLFLNFQREAREKGKGLWGAATVLVPGGEI